MAMKGESISMKTEEAVKQLSIIIPMYNAEKTIQKCLRSLILPKEQMERLEVIVVDDGSLDRSAAYADWYRRKYPGSFQLVRKPNGGHGSAVNAGAARCSGRYLKVLDADDWMHTDSLEEVLELLETVDAQVVACGYDQCRISAGSKDCRMKERICAGSRTSRTEERTYTGSTNRTKKNICAGRAARTKRMICAGRSVRRMKVKEKGACGLDHARLIQISAGLEPDEKVLHLNMEQLLREWERFRQIFCLHGLIYQTEFYRQLSYRMPEGVSYDDAFFFTVPCSHAKRLCVIRTQLYVYRIGDPGQSVSAQNREKRIHQMEQVIWSITAANKSRKCLQAGREYYYRKLVSVISDYYVTAFLRCSDKKRGRKAAQTFTGRLRRADQELYHRLKSRYWLLLGMGLCHRTEQDFERLLCWANGVSTIRKRVIM